MELPEGKRQAIPDAIYGGQNIEASKLVREAGSCVIKEAKEFVEKLSNKLSAKGPGTFTTALAGKSGCAGVILAVTALLAAPSGLRALISG